MWWVAIHSEENVPGQRDWFVQHSQVHRLTQHTQALQRQLREAEWRIQIEAQGHPRVVAELQQSVVQLSAERKRLERLSEQLIEQRCLADEQHATRLATAQDEIQLAREQGAALAGELERLRAERTEVQARAERLTQHTRELEQQLVDSESHALNELQSHARVIAELQQSADQQLVERECLERLAEQQGRTADQLARQLAAAELENESMRAQATAIADELARLRACWLEQQGQFQRLTRDTEALQQRLADSESRAGAETQQHARIVTELQQNAAQQSAEREQIERLVEQLRRSGEQRSGQLAAANQEVKSRKEREDFLSVEVRRFHAACSEQQIHTERLTLLNQSQQRQLADSEARAEQEAQQHADSVAALQRRCRDDLSAECQRLESLAEKERDQCTVTANDLAFARDEIGSLLTRQAELSTELADVRADREAQRQRAERVSEQLDLLQQAHEDCKNQLVGESARQAELAAELHTIRAQFSNESERLLMRLRSADETIGRTAMELDNTLQQLRQSENVATRATEELDRTQLDLAQSRESSARAAVELDRLCKDYEITLAKQATLSEELAGARAGWDAEQQQAQSLSAELSSLRREVQDSRLRTATEAEDAAKSEKKLQGRCAQLVTENSRLQNSVKQQLEAAATAAAQRDTACQQVETLLARHAEWNAELIETRTDRDAERALADQLRQQLVHAAAETMQNAELASELRIVRAQFAAECAELQKLAAWKDESARQAESELAAARHKIDALARREAELAGQLVDMQTMRDADQTTRSQQAELIVALRQQLGEQETRIADAFQKLAETQKQHQQESKKLRRRSLDEPLDRWHEERQRLLQQLQREAAARRKAESALRREVAQPDCAPQVHGTLSQIQSERFVERLQRELVAAKDFQKLLMRRAGQCIDQLQQEINRLRQDLSEAINRKASA